MFEHLIPNRLFLYSGSCLDLLAALPPNSIDAGVTDPPYHLNFMNKQWDGGDIAFQPTTWAAVLRTFKPGAHLLAFGGTRTFHRMACAIEDAGFEIRDTVCWLYGQGFPKSHNAGNGWGTALKPAFEPIILARKPLIGTVAANVLAHGTGALNIDACRVGTSKNVPASVSRTAGTSLSGSVDGSLRRETGNEDGHNPNIGRWPANVVHDGSDEALQAFPDSAARFFYCAKASSSERNGSKHPTVKPLALMRYLCRLITPPNGLILDPFAGTGTTGEAAHLEGFRAVLCEQDAAYQADVRRRLNPKPSSPEPPA